MINSIRAGRGRAVFAVAGTAAVLAVAACSSSSGSSASSGSSGGSAQSGSTGSASAPSSTTNVSDVTLTIGDQKGTGAEALLQAAGLINKLPFKVKWVDFTSGPPMVQAMGSGSVDIGGVGDAPPVFAAAGGSKVKIVGARITPAAAGAVVVPKGSTLTSIKQLKGKTIAAPEGTTADYHLLTVLAAAGLTKSQVTVENLQPADALAAFNSGKIDAWDTGPPPRTAGRCWPTESSTARRTRSRSPRTPRWPTRARRPRSTITRRSSTRPTSGRATTPAPGPRSGATPPA